MSESRFSQAQRLAAMSRAARLIAANRAGDSAGIATVVTEARAEDDGYLILALSAAVFASDLADRVHGDRAQVELDGLALDAMFYEERELRRSAENTDE